MYPAAMTLPMPNGPCVAVALPEDNAARLSWLHETCLSSLNWESDAEEDYDFPPELHDHLDWAPPARMKVGKGLHGPHTADMAERLGRPLPVALREARALPRHARGGGRGRQAAQVPAGLTQNAIFGRCCMNPDEFRNTNAYVDLAKFERAVGKSSVTNFELQINDSEGFLAFVETLKTDRSKACMSVPTQSAPARCSSPSS